MKIIKEMISIFKKPLLVIAGFTMLFLLLGKGLPAIRDLIVGRSPIVGIEAKNEREYLKTATIKVSDFDLYYIHKNGKKTRMNKDDVTLSTTKPSLVGATTKVTIKKEKWACTVNVKNKRQIIAEFECGKPNLKDVKATIYSNGELSFTGNGNILSYKNNDYPWLSYDKKDDNPITAITFENTVKPIYMDGYFKDLKQLTYVEAIPDSVESMEETFFGCISLTTAPDLEKCKKLVNMSSCFANCDKMVSPPAVPSSVKNLNACFENCVELKTGADVSRASNVLTANNMYAGCSTLNEAELPPNVKVIDETFMNCINIKKMPVIPDTVESMEDTFENNISLIETTAIPAYVKSVSGCFQGCTKLKGILVINGNPQNYSGFLSNAAIATNLDLQGDSKMLDILAQQGKENPYITVNGNRPNYDINYNDYDF